MKYIMIVIISIAAFVHVGAVHAFSQERAIDSAVDINYSQAAQDEMEHRATSPVIKVDTPKEWAKERSEDEDGFVIETISGSEEGKPYLE
jgi:hypothetical protein